jgi:hypothetical protein
MADIASCRCMRISGCLQWLVRPPTETKIRSNQIIEGFAWAGLSEVRAGGRQSVANRLAICCDLHAHDHAMGLRTINS